MREDVRNKMFEEYNALKIKGKSTCIKYRYDFNKTNVNIYFDAFDKNSYALSLILSAEKQFYFTTLNVMNTSIRKEYLPELPEVFLKNIVTDGMLDDFYCHMEDKILKTNPIILSYKKDIIFKNTTDFKHGEIDLPFWWHIRKMRMTDTTLEQLSERADISRKVLKKLQEKGLTLVRTADSNKRRELKIILEEEKITLE